VIFAVAVILGAMLGAKMSKRGKLVGSMISGSAPADAPKELEKSDKQISLISMILPILLMCILALAIYGRLGGQ
jgi:H+/gluconate symporter-like permease